MTGSPNTTKASLTVCRVEISYDPMDTKTITIRYQGMEPFTAGPVKIDAFCDKTPTLPKSMNPKEAEVSRLLAALEKQSEQSRQRWADAITFGGYRRDGGRNV